MGTQLATLRLYLIFEQIRYLWVSVGMTQTICYCLLFTLLALQTMKWQKRVICSRENDILVFLWSSYCQDLQVRFSCLVFDSMHPKTMLANAIVHDSCSEIIAEESIGHSFDRDSGTLNVTSNDDVNPTRKIETSRVSKYNNTNTVIVTLDITTNDSI
jgi:hypothetical protein